MSLLMSASERLYGFVATEADSLKVAQIRTLLVFVSVLFTLIWFLQRCLPIMRVLEMLLKPDIARRAECPSPVVVKSMSPPKSEESTPAKQADVLVAKPTVQAPVQKAEASCKDAHQILGAQQDAKPPASSPHLTASSLCLGSDCQEASEETPWFTEAMSGLDEVWSDSSELLCGPEAAVTADANSVLETALASGDAKLADAALAAGIRLCSSSWLTNAHAELQAAGIPVMSERMLDLIRVYGQDRRADLAVDLWEMRCAELDLDLADGDDSTPPPAAELYGASLEACARAGDFESAARAASSTGWKVPACRHGQAAFLALARWYARRQDVNQALVCYEAVRSITGNADLPTHRAVLVASVRSADMARADMLFQDLIQSGINPDGATFSAMICGHCSAGNIDKAMHHFRLLRDRGIVPTAPLFDAILDGCAWMNMPALVEQVLADMEGAGVRPSTTTLSILMRLHGSNRDTEKALELFDEIPKKHGLKLDGHAFGSLISVCLKNDVFDMAWNAFERMQKDGCVAHARIYDNLIGACLRRGLLDNAVQVILEAMGTCKEQLPEEPAAPRMRLEPKTIEETLTAVGRRRQAARLGMPLIEQLTAAGVEVPETLVDAMSHGASQESCLCSSELHSRRMQRQSWRSFQRSQIC